MTTDDRGMYEDSFIDNVLPDEVLNALLDEQESAECPDDGSGEVASSSNQAPNHWGQVALTEDLEKGLKTIGILP